jgi:polygalacturonase
MDTLSSRRAVLTAGAALPALAGCASVPLMSSRTQIRPAAPFDMPAITIPDFSGARRFLITDFGAVAGDKDKTTAAIAQAIAAANTAGSGVVVIPAGEWLTGAIHFKSHVNLHVSKGATLLFSERPEDYLPPVQTSWEGIECLNYSPLVYAFDCENVALTGEGKLQAKLDIWRDWYERPKAHLDASVELYNKAHNGVPVSERDMTTGLAHMRPQFIQFNRCRHVLIEGISIQDSPFWTVHILLCTDVVARRVSISAHGHNNDGIDPEMTQNMLIEDCTFDQGDDAISVKSGREFDGWRLATPSKNIVIRNCHIKNGHQLLAIGSELSGGVENVFVDNCHFARGDAGEKRKGDTVVEINNILYVKTNERRGGYVKNIIVTNVSATKIAGGALCVETDVLYQWKNLVPTYERRLTPIEGLHVGNITIGEAKFVCKITAEKDMPVKDVTLDKVSIKTVTGTPVTTEYVEGFVNRA